MNEDRVVGTATNLGGKAQEGLGRASGDVSAQAKGVINQAAGTAQELYGQAKESVSDAYGQAKAASQLASVEGSVVVTVELVEQRRGRLLGLFEIDGSVVIGIKQPHRAAWRGESRSADEDRANRSEAI